MDNVIKLTGFVAIPMGVVGALATPIGLAGSFALMGGSALGTLAGNYLGRCFVRPVRLSPELLQIIVIAAIFFSSIAGGWALANLCNFPITFEACTLTQFGGILLNGALFSLYSLLF